MTAKILAIIGITIEKNGFLELEPDLRSVSRPAPRDFSLIRQKMIRNTISVSLVSWKRTRLIVVFQIYPTCLIPVQQGRVDMPLTPTE